MIEETLAACVKLGRECGYEEGHSLQDARLAVRLYDLLSDLHHLDDRARELLECAAVLHDIGYVEGYWGHHKTAYNLILKADLPGLDERERQMVALVARYHRGAQPSTGQKGYAALDPEDREAVALLGAILRLADGLDRTHTDAVRDVEVAMDGERLVVWADCPGECEAEIWAAEKKGRFLGEVLGVEISVRRQGGPLD